METVRDYPWFYRMERLLDEVTLDWFPCSHGELPSLDDDRGWARVDSFYREEMLLEAQGWKCYSLAIWSQYELTHIKRFIEETQLARLHPPTETIDTYPIIGTHENLCSSVAVHPDAQERFVDLLMSFHRPSLIVTREDTAKLTPYLPENHLVLIGSECTAVSYDLVSAEAQAEILALHDPRLTRVSSKILESV
jgi:hypothetical protein